MLRRWWCQKYQMPPTSVEYEKYTLIDLWLEFYEDYFSENSDKAFEEITESGDIRFVTGDPEIDELEKQIAEGTLTSDEITAVVKSWTKSSPTPPIDEEIEEIEDIGEGFSDSAPNGRWA